MTETKPTKKVILVVDDQEELRKSIARILKIAGYATLEASSGKAALQILAMEHVDLVISDIRMPEMNGIELLHNVKRAYKAPFVMMTGFSEIIETTEAYEIGADGFLMKPFQQADLLKTLQEAFESRRRKEEAAKSPDAGITLSQRYCAIPVTEFVTGREIRFPIYLRLSDEKFVRIAFCGEDLPSGKIETLKQKGVFFLYLERNDFRSYVAFTSKLSQSIVAGKEIETTRKARFLRHCSEVILEYGFQQHVDQDIFNFAKANIEQSLSILSDEPQILNLLETLTSHSTALYSHSIAVALVSSLSAKAMGWESSPMFFRLVAAAVFHDIGKRDLDPELLKKPLHAMTPEEKTLYEAHPQKGAELLAAVEGMPTEIPQIVAHHHEQCDGAGFPAGLGTSKIHPVAKVISAADEFCKWFRGAPGYGEGCPPERAIAEMERRNRADGNLSVKWDALPAIKKVFDEYARKAS